MSEEGKNELEEEKIKMRKILKEEVNWKEVGIEDKEDKKEGGIDKIQYKKLI